jgi:protoheme IX farnesyltransferase
VIGGAGMLVLLHFVNPLTMWLTFATFVGYAVVYTMLLKPMTPQNIVIGGASGAMPPALGWAAMADQVPAQAWILVLIIFVWTPPHFWALALYRTEDFRKSGLPMLPVTHGSRYTRLNILLYTIVLVAVTMLPFAMRMSGWLYLVAALVLGAQFLRLSWSIWRAQTEPVANAIARRTFRYSIVYLSLLFAALLVDHYVVG